MAPSPSLDLVVCTFNRAAALDVALRSIGGLRTPGDLAWSVLVVDNASTDGTADVVNRHAASGLPVRYVREPNLGLTPARLRGVRETAGEWIAFVDDDNLLDEGWLLAIAEAILRWPHAGGFASRVILQWEKRPSPEFRHFGYCFAEQDLGETAHEVRSLAGAGMVLRRAALEASGWTRRPVLADRVGRKLISGGDAEMSLRVAGAGHPLIYLPSAIVRHLQPAFRSSPAYLVRIAWSLAVAEPQVRLLGWRGGVSDWVAHARAEHRARLRQARTGLAWSLRHRRERFSALVWLVAALGYGHGVRRVMQLSPARLEELCGAALTPDISR